MLDKSYRLKRVKWRQLKAQKKTIDLSVSNLSKKCREIVGAFLNNLSMEINNKLSQLLVFLQFTRSVLKIPEKTADSICSIAEIAKSFKST